MTNSVPPPATEERAKRAVPTKSAVVVAVGLLAAAGVVLRTSSGRGLPIDRGCAQILELAADHGRRGDVGFTDALNQLAEADNDPDSDEAEVAAAAREVVRAATAFDADALTASSDVCGDLDP